MRPFHPLVAIYTEGTACSSFRTTARTAFAPRDVIEIGTNSLRDPGLMRALDLVIFPGVFSEHSPYHERFDSGVVNALHAGFDAGLCVWASCAPANNFWDSIDYSSPAKTVKGKKGLSLFKGRAAGPVDGQNPPLDPGDIFSDTRVLNVTFNDVSGREITAGICYANGPGFYPLPEERLDEIARFTDIPGRPLAIVGKSIGNGYALLAGALPEMGLPQVPNVPAEMHKHSAHFAQLRAELAPHENGRLALLDVIVDKFDSQWRGARGRFTLG